MKTYISMLRGINVSGQKLIKMPELAELYKSLEFTHVRTYIQSGNVIFSTNSDLPAKELTKNIETAIREKFKFDVPVIIRTAEELKTILAANPFQNPDGTIADKIYITFLENEPPPENVDQINPLNYLPDRYVIKGKEIYLNCAGGYGITKLSNNFFESKLKVRATTRNWKTISTLIEMDSDVHLQ